MNRRHFLATLAAVLPFGGALVKWIGNREAHTSEVLVRRDAGKWVHLATFMQPEKVTFYVDGKPVAEAEYRRAAPDWHWHNVVARRAAGG